jgi:hypothetical protein
MYAFAIVSGALSLVVARVSSQVAIAIVIGLAFAGMAAIYLLESVPFERQAKLPKSSPAS